MHLRSVKRCAELWGRAEVLHIMPRIKAVADAIYLPWSHGGPWGVFDNDGHAIHASLNLRTIEGCTSGPQPSFTKSPLHIEEERQEPYLYLGILTPHFGHFIINSFSRLWPMIYTKARLPRVVWHTIGESAGYSSYGHVTTILAGLDLSLDEIETFDKPIRFRRLLVPETSFFEQFCAHKVFETIASKAGAGLYLASEVDKDATPAYLSKTRLKAGVGRFSNEQTIEDIMLRNGIDVIYPELLSFPEQVRLFARRRCILSTSGSALHTSIFSPPCRRIISLNPTEQINSNFILIDLLNRNRASYYFPHGTTYCSSDTFLTEHRMSDPAGVAEDLLRLADAK